MSSSTPGGNLHHSKPRIPHPHLWHLPRPSTRACFFLQAHCRSTLHICLKCCPFPQAYIKLTWLPRPLFTPIFWHLHGFTTVYMLHMVYCLSHPNQMSYSLRAEASSLPPQPLEHCLARSQNNVNSLEKLNSNETDKQQVVNIPLTTISSTTLFHKVWFEPVWQLDFQHEWALQILAVTWRHFLEQKW